MARKWLWIGLVAPFSYSASESASQAVSSLNLTELIRGGIPFICILAALGTCRHTRRRFGLAEWCLVGFLVLALASTAWSISANATLLKAISVASGYVCLLLLVRLYEDLSSAVSGLMTFVHVVLILTVVEAILLNHLAFQSAGNLHRLILVFPQTGSDVLATVCLVGLIAVVTNTGPVLLRGPWVRALLVGIYLLELLETRTRTALVLAGLLLFIGAFAWARRSANSVPTIAFCTAVMLVSLLLGGAAASSFFYRQQSTTTLTTLTGRTLYWSEAVTAWQTSPIFGLGYYSGHREGVLLEPGQTAPSNLDETWLETLVDTGVAGCTLLAAFALAGMTRLIHSRGLLPPNVRWCVFALGALVLPITSFVNPTIQANISPNFLVWGFLLLMFPPSRSLAARSDPVRRSVSMSQTSGLQIAESAPRFGNASELAPVRKRPR